MAASAGTTPFDVLFLFLSFFVIVAALMLVALQFRLGVERRAREIGTLLAVGFRRPLATRLFSVEGAAVAAVGGLLGVAVGVGYAWLMLAGLQDLVDRSDLDAVSAAVSSSRSVWPSATSAAWQSAC